MASKKSARKKSASKPKTAGVTGPTSIAAAKPPKTASLLVPLGSLILIIWLVYSLWFKGSPNSPSTPAPAASTSSNTAPSAPSAPAGVQPGPGSGHMTVTLKIDGVKTKSGSVGWSTDNSGNPNVDKSIRGTPLKIADKVYAHGIGTHAPSDIVFALDGKVKRFSCLVGADDSGGSSDSVVFSVLADGKRVYKSRVMSSAQSPIPVNLDVNGVKDLTLNVDYAPGSDSWGHADWLNIRFEKGASSAQAPPQEGEAPAGN